PPRLDRQDVPLPLDRSSALAPVRSSRFVQQRPRDQPRQVFFRNRSRDFQPMTLGQLAQDGNGLFLESFAEVTGFGHTLSLSFRGIATTAEYCLRFERFCQSFLSMQ